MGGRGKGISGLREKERKLREAASAHSKRSQGLLQQMRAPWGEAKKRYLVKAPLFKMRPFPLPPLGKREVTWGRGDAPRCCSCGAQRGG